MTLLRFLLVLAPAAGRRRAASAETSTHWCGGSLLFVREADGHSYERCSGCGWSYDFDTGRPSDALYAPATGTAQ